MTRLGRGESDYLNRKREAERNVEVMWLVGRLVPDHKTIAK